MCMFVPGGRVSNPWDFSSTLLCACASMSLQSSCGQELNRHMSTANHTHTRTHTHHTHTHTHTSHTCMHTHKHTHTHHTGACTHKHTHTHTHTHKHTCTHIHIQTCSQRLGDIHIQCFQKIFRPLLFFFILSYCSYMLKSLK